MKSGEVATVEERRSLDDDVADPGWNHAVEKFHALTDDLLPAGTGEKLVSIVKGLERQQSMTELLDATRLSAPAA